MRVVLVWVSPSCPVPVRPPPSKKVLIKKTTKYDERTLLTTTKHSQGYEHSSVLEEHRQINGHWKKKITLKKVTY